MEGDVTVDDALAEPLHTDGVVAIGDLLLGIQHIEDTGGCGQRVLDPVVQTRQVLRGPVDHRRDGEEGGQDTLRDVPETVG